jgi:two-component sensor histidine kinase
VAAVIERSREAAQSPDEHIETLIRRIQSMADTHALLSRTQWTGASLKQICTAELGLYAQGDNVAITGRDFLLNADAAQAFSMVLHELTTNATKHGALSRAGGHVALDISVIADMGERLRLKWRESGGPPVSEPVRKSYGMQIIEGLLEFEADGSVRLQFNPQGLECEMIVPVAKVGVTPGSPN